MRIQQAQNQILINIMMLSIFNKNNSNNNRMLAPAMSLLMPSAHPSDNIFSANNKQKTLDKPVLVLVDTGSVNLAKKIDTLNSDLL
jgi:hypothetical protein